MSAFLNAPHRQPHRSISPLQSLESPHLELYTEALAV